MTDAWVGLERFLEPGREVLAARDGAEVAERLAALDRRAARAIGDAARRRVLAHHTYARRAEAVEAALGIAPGGAPRAAAALAPGVAE